MLNSVFQGLFDTDMTSVIAPGDFLLCILASLAAGFLLAAAYMYKARYTKSFVVTLASLPAIVCVVIMMVNGNVGTGVAVAGTFGLVRFRSVPGTAKEIGAIFLAMGTGLLTGMGYLAYALLFVILISLVNIFYSSVGFGGRREKALCRTLQITIPEDLDYPEIFDSILQKYAKEWKLVQVKTTNMGSLFRLTYEMTLRDAAKEKAMLDQIRRRNGNLEITIAHQEQTALEL